MVLLLGISYKEWTCYFVGNNKAWRPGTVWMSLLLAKCSYSNSQKFNGKKKEKRTGFTCILQRDRHPPESTTHQHLLGCLTLTQQCMVRASCVWPKLCLQYAHRVFADCNLYVRSYFLSGQLNSSISPIYSTTVLIVSATVVVLRVSTVVWCTIFCLKPIVIRRLLVRCWLVSAIPLQCSPSAQSCHT